MVPAMPCMKFLLVPGHDQASIFFPTKKYVNAQLGHLVRVVKVAAVEDHRRFIWDLMRSKSGSRKLDHSVLMTRASAPSRVS